MIDQKKLITSRWWKGQGPAGQPTSHYRQRQRVREGLVYG